MTARFLLWVLCRDDGGLSIVGAPLPDRRHQQRELAEPAVELGPQLGERRLPPADRGAGWSRDGARMEPGWSRVSVSAAAVAAAAMAALW